MSGGQESWHAVAAIGDLPEAEMVEVAVGQALVVLVRRGDEVAAFQGLCPHQFARLAEGRVEGGWLHCPRHHARFLLDDGRCGPGWALPPLKRFQVRVEGGSVMLSNPLVVLT